MCCPFFPLLSSSGQVAIGTLLSTPSICWYVSGGLLTSLHVLPVGARQHVVVGVPLQEVKEASHTFVHLPQLSLESVDVH
jgi:hypothetical protein